MVAYTTQVKDLGELRLPGRDRPLREHRAAIRALGLLYPDAKVRLIKVASQNGRTVTAELDPMPTWTR